MSRKEILNSRINKSKRNKSKTGRRTQKEEKGKIENLSTPVDTEMVETLVASFETVALTLFCQGIASKTIKEIIGLMDLVKEVTGDSPNAKSLSKIVKQVKALESLAPSQEEANVALASSKEKDVNLTSRMTEFLRSRGKSFAFYDAEEDELIGSIADDYKRFTFAFRDPNPMLFAPSKVVNASLLQMYKKNITASDNTSFESMVNGSTYLLASIGAINGTLHEFHEATVKKTKKKMTAPPKAGRNFPTELVFLENGANRDMLEASFAISKIRPHMDDIFQDIQLLPVEIECAKPKPESSYESVFGLNVAPLLTVTEQGIGSPGSYFIDTSVARAALYDKLVEYIPSDSKYAFLTEVAVEGQSVAINEDETILAVKTKWSSALTPQELEKANTIGFVDKSTLFSYAQAASGTKRLDYDFDVIYDENLFVEVCFETSLVLVVPIEWINPTSSLISGSPHPGLFPISPELDKKMPFVTSFAFAMRSRALLHGRIYALPEDRQHILSKIATVHRPKDLRLLDLYLETFLYDNSGHTPHYIVRQAASIKDEDVKANISRSKYDRSKRVRKVKRTPLNLSRKRKIDPPDDHVKVSQIEDVTEEHTPPDDGGDSASDDEEIPPEEYEQYESSLDESMDETSVNDDVEFRSSNTKSDDTHNSQESSEESNMKF